MYPSSQNLKLQIITIHAIIKLKKYLIISVYGIWEDKKCAAFVALPAKF